MNIWLEEDGDGKYWHIVSHGWRYTDGAFVPMSSACFDTREEAETYGRQLRARLTRGLERSQIEEIDTAASM